MTRELNHGFSSTLNKMLIICKSLASLAYKTMNKNLLCHYHAEYIVQGEKQNETCMCKAPQTVPSASLKHCRLYMEHVCVPSYSGGPNFCGFGTKGLIRG